MQHLTSPTFPFCYIISCTPGNSWHFLTASPLNSINPITHSPYFHPIHQVNPHNISYIFSTILTCMFDVLPRYLSIARKVSLYFGILLCFQTLYPVCKLVLLVHHVHITAFMFLQCPLCFIKPLPEFAWGFRDSVVGIMTTLKAGRYWFKFGMRYIFFSPFTLSKPHLGPKKPPIQLVPGFLARVKAARERTWPLTSI